MDPRTQHRDVMLQVGKKEVSSKFTAEELKLYIDKFDAEVQPSPELLRKMVSRVNVDNFISFMQTMKTALCEYCMKFWELTILAHAFNKVAPFSTMFSFPMGLDNCCATIGHSSPMQNDQGEVVCRFEPVDTCEAWMNITNAGMHACGSPQQRYGVHTFSAILAKPVKIVRFYCEIHFMSGLMCHQCPCGTFPSSPIEVTLPTIVCRYNYHFATIVFLLCPKS